MAAFREGNEVYENNDDYASMQRAGALLSRALRYEIYGTGILRTEDLGFACHRTLFGSAFPPPDGRSFPYSAASQLRLAMTVIKKYGWQPAEWGGSGSALADFMLKSFAILTMAIAPPDRPWEGDLKDFFTRNPVHIETPEPQPAHQGPTQDNRDAFESIDRIKDTIEAADTGDAAAAEHVRGYAASETGDEDAAQVHYVRAAEMGDIGAMYDAGCGYHRRGQREDALRWFRAASDGGHSYAMQNLGAILIQDGDVEGAAHWWQRAGEAGNPDGYAALTQLADELGNQADELRWSKLGAEADQPFCMLRYGQLLLRSDPTNAHLVTTQAIPMLMRAAGSGQTDALFLIGIAYGGIQDRQNAAIWLRRAEAAGDTDAARVIREHGL